MAVVRGSEVLEASQVRVCSADGAVVGAGFVVAPDVVCTCAHVAAGALGVPSGGAEAPGGAVDLEFPLLPGRPTVRAAVVSWRRGGHDVALLRLEAAVEGARPVPLVDGSSVWGHTFRALGYPAAAERGVWAWGTMRAGQGSGWVQMETQEPGPRITEGFSGSPVWDDVQDGVVGMTVAAHRGERTAYLLPSAELVDEETLRTRSPFRGLAAFAEDDAEFFHGRDGDIRRVHAAVRRRPVTLLVGPSGCGKSSLARAGVLPRLRAAGTAVSVLRPVPGVRAPAVLARALLPVLEPGLGEVEQLARAADLTRLLESGQDLPGDLRGRILGRGERTGHVLFVDQLEEYAAADAGAARALFGLLTALTGRDGGTFLHVVATARPDSLDALVTAETSDVISEAVEFLAPLAGHGLEQAVTAPVDAVPGLWFEPGLPERIIADARDEPGRMTLVQFALTQLWRRRHRSMLTHAAYDELGGVAGALVEYADDVLAGLTREQRGRARRLFVQLARPEADGFVRQPARLAALAPDLADMARELAPSKLLVLSRPPGGTGEIVDLAHEALTRLWPRLRQWLADTRDFRAWQEQLRADLQRWRDQQRESARLLGGTDLAEAERRLSAHPDDVSADERRYVRLSRRHARRGNRVRGAAVGALAVLAVLAVVLAVTARESLAESERQLRIQAAGLLAQAAEDTPGDDPATALQLALAAWNTRQSPETRDALLHQYVRGQYLLDVHPSVWPGQITHMEAAPDGRTLLVASRPSGGDRRTFTVVTGAVDGDIRTTELGGVPAGDFVSAVSPDGRHVAVSTGGELRLWRVSDPGEPVDLSLADHELPDSAGGTLDFSSDGKRLLMTMDDHSVECFDDPGTCVPAFAEVWHVPSGDRMQIAEGLVHETRVDEAAFTADPDTVAVSRWDGTTTLTEVKDLTTGRTLYSPGAEGADSEEDVVTSTIAAGGEVGVAVIGGRTHTLLLGRTPGPGTVLPTAGGNRDATGNYSVEGSGTSGDVEAGGYADSTVTDLRTGAHYRTRVPTSGDVPATYSEFAAVPREDGSLAVLVPVGTTLVVVRADPSGGRRFQAGDDQGARYALSPDGRSLARVTSETLEITDASRTRLASVPIPAAERHADWRATWTADSRHVVVWGRQGGLHRAFAAQNPKESVPLPDEVRDGTMVDALVGLQDSEIVLLTEDGTLARVDAADGTVLAEPFLAHPGPNSNGPVGDLFVHGQLMPRPRHPGQVAVVTRAGAVRGEILLWDVPARKRLTTLTGPSIVVAYASESTASSVVFAPDGSRLAVQNADGQTRVWDVGREERLPADVTRSSLNTPIGFGEDGSLVTYLGARGLVEIHDLTDGSSVTLAVGSGVSEEVTHTTAQIAQGHLLVDNGHGRRTFDLRPEAQFRALCAAAGRDYTEAERALLPQGTPPEPPCP